MTPDVDASRSPRRIALVGAGSSARRFCEHFLGGDRLVGVYDSLGQGLLHGLPVRPIDAIRDVAYDRVVIASWAVDVLCAKLMNSGIPAAHVDVFLNDRDRVIPHAEWTATVAGQAAHFDLGTPLSVLYAFYDLNVARPTFDILAFLCLAENARRRQGLDAVHLVVVPPALNEFNQQLLPVIPVEEQRWRTQQILLPAASLLPSSAGVTMLPSRELVSALAGMGQVFPPGYSEQRPLALWEFEHVVDSVAQGDEIRWLQATPAARGMLHRWMVENVPPQRRIVSITLRDSSLQQARNSNLEAWYRFIEKLDRQRYFPVVIPDTEKALQPSAFKDIACIFTEAAFNLDLRLALYETSHVNLGVANGPTHLWVFSRTCRYLMFKQIVNDYSHSSAESFLRRRLEIGGAFPGAGPFQRLVWHDDTWQTIRSFFEQFCAEIETETGTP